MSYNPYVEYAVPVASKDQAEEFLRFLWEHKIEWSTGKGEPTYKILNWDSYKEDTHYYIENWYVTYGDRFCIGTHTVLMSVEDFEALFEVAPDVPDIDFAALL